MRRVLNVPHSREVYITNECDFPPEYKQKVESCESLGMKIKWHENIHVVMPWVPTDAKRQNWNTRRAFHRKLHGAIYSCVVLCTHVVWIKPDIFRINTKTIPGLSGCENVRPLDSAVSTILTNKDLTRLSR